MRKNKSNSFYPAKPGHSLAEKFPNLLLDWDYEKNNLISPNDISATSRYAVWWKREKCGHSWYSCVSDNTKRASGGQECPVCWNEYIITHRANNGKKICSYCFLEKTIDCFYHSKSKIDNLYSQCKPCTYKTQYKSNNIDILLRKILTTKKGNAKKKNLICDIDFDWFKNRFLTIEGKCEISKIEFDLYGKNNQYQCSGPLSLSFDRIDPNLPYTKENTRLILYCLNTFMGKMDDKTAFELIKKIAAQI